ncbi:MAG: SH3 domain-containing protein, partial [Anaerolineales bacterium]|nr:SH3 domain-containing protein [Anaerolineales bacterium]
IRARQVVPSPTPTITIDFRRGLKRQLATVNAPLINLRAGPGTDTPIVGAARQGQTFAVISRQAGWVQVAQAAGAAWLFGELLTLTTEGDATPPTPAPVDPLQMSSAWADLQLARAIATQAFAPPDPELLSACHSRLEALRNDLWQAQLARDAAKVKANEPGSSTPWESIHALEAGLFERERQIAEQEEACRQLARQPYARDDFDRQIAAARLQQAEIDYLQKIATPTPRPTATATPTPTPRPTLPPPDYSETYVVSLVAGDVYAVKIVQVNGNEATVEIQVAIGYGQPDAAAPPSLAGDAPLTVIDHGAISAAFTRSGVDIEALLIARIEDAQTSIDVAAFEFDLDRVADALLAAHRRGVTVRWVTDDEYGLDHDSEPGHGQFGRLAAAGIPVHSDAGTALMHNKFWIFDNQTVWTGSTNITLNGTQRNNNNVLIFESAAVAEIYTREFEEMWAGQFGAGSPSHVGAQTVELDGIPVEILFGPEDRVADRLTQLILDAQDNIKFMAFSFTHDGMGEALQQKAQELGAVQGIFEARSSATEHSELTRLHCQSSAQVRTDGNPAIMHHKVIIIDDAITVAGSFNFSRNADENNDENLVIIQSEEIAQAYLEEFERRWQEASAPGVECR